MAWVLYIVAGAFVLLGAVCLVLIVLQLPGGWIMLGLAVVIELADGLYLPAEQSVTFGWWLLGVCTGLLVISEVIELAVSASGARRSGASRRGMVGALIGGIGGAIALTPLLPIPVVGTLVGALLGTFVGAVVGEMGGATPRTMRASVRPATGAAIGRAVGTATKLGIGITIWIVLSVAAFWP